MSSPMSVFDIAGRAMSSQIVRLNAIASNMANAGTVSTTKEGAYRALKPVFTEVSDAPGVATVKVSQVVQIRDRADPAARSLQSARRQEWRCVGRRRR